MKNQGFDLSRMVCVSAGNVWQKTLENLDAEEFDRAVERYLHRQDVSISTPRMLPRPPASCCFSGFAVWALMSL